ncbi:MAG: hypothetical protein RL095_2542 [Verrucomicrobiota bacterium]|jgi:hypothetical protein
MKPCDKHQQQYLLDGDSPHLRDCPECAAFARDSGRFLAARPPALAPAKSSDRFILAHAAAARPRRKSPFSAWRIILAAALPAAAALLFCLLPAAKPPPQPSPPPSSTPIESPASGAPSLDFGGACINEELKILEQDLITLEAELTFASH